MPNPSELEAMMKDPRVAKAMQDPRYQQIMAQQMGMQTPDTGLGNIEQYNIGAKPKKSIKYAVTEQFKRIYDSVMKKVSSSYAAKHGYQR